MRTRSSRLAKHLVLLKFVGFVFLASTQLVSAEDATGFEHAPGAPIAVEHVWTAVIDDFDADGILDIVVLSPSYYSELVEGGAAAVEFLRGRGDGSFEPSVVSPVGEESWNCISVTAGDFTGDGWVDLLVTNPGSGDDHVGAVGVFLLTGDGTGSFTPSPHGIYPTDLEPVAIAFGDFDDDGNTDLAVACSWGAAVTVMFGDGVDGFLPIYDYWYSRYLEAGIPYGYPEGWAGDPRLIFNIELGHNTMPLAIVVADFDENGMEDLATSNGTSDSVSILLSADFEPGIIYVIEIPVLGRSESLVVADFNEDGHQDLVATNQFGLDDWPLEETIESYLSILLGEGDGTFREQLYIKLDGDGPQVIATADFDGDGHLDLVTANGSSSDLSVLHGDGAGGFVHAAFSPLHVEPYPKRGWNSTTWVGIGDFNGDGRPDLAATSADHVDILLNVLVEATP